ncbi:hypothetical protein DA075_19050 [Methylobacterium currus]|uniref:FAD-binding oxidoreductase/transferase type 4 C-terminal domain-containing protein n=1 Tax=Methylobacterium currus TaxID=2051553 RepID=A0A2R4WMG6_9HYPH|nr:hypothetical protein DA075_19050 [Methylobacterium currus]
MVSPRSKRGNAHPRREFKRQQALVHDETRRQRGSISAEHGIGQLRVSEMERCKSPVELDLMTSIKALLDPRGRLNPGKLLPGSRTTNDLARGAN